MLLCATLASATATLLWAEPPKIGEKVPDFSLSSIDGKLIRLGDWIAAGPVVLVVLRGYPGYQCPFCSRQAADFLRNAHGFSDAGTRVILVYPGPPDGLQQRASEFVAGRSLPNGFDLLLDPDYKITNLYGVRWDAPHETAYPSTFVISRAGVVLFSRISKQHGGRTTAAEVLDALKHSRSQQQVCTGNNGNKLIGTRPFLVCNKFP